MSRVRQVSMLNTFASQVDFFNKNSFSWYIHCNDQQLRIITERINKSTDPPKPQLLHNSESWIMMIMTFIVNQNYNDDQNHHDLLLHLLHCSHQIIVAWKDKMRIFWGKNTEFRSSWEILTCWVRLNNVHHIVRSHRLNQKQWSPLHWFDTKESISINRPSSSAFSVQSTLSSVASELLL